MHPAVTELWDSVRDEPFPEDIPPELEEEVDVDLLDTTAREAIQAYLLAGSLDSVSDGQLRACLQELSDIVPQLTGNAAKYFGGIRDVAELIVGKRARPGPPLMG